MIEKYTTLLARISQKHASPFYKSVSLAFGALFFLIILPSIFFLIGINISRCIPVNIPRVLEIVIAALTISVGLFFIGWATLTQIKIGHGTPAPNAPTQKLVIVGPYRHCRNPIQFGAMLYYLGAGTLAGTVVTGIICCFLGFAVGTLYHALVEEKELALRFGDDYLRYKQTTPFLLPRFWR